MIEFSFETDNVFSFSEATVVRVVKQIITDANFELGDINYVFGSDDWLLRYNQEYLNHDYYTDIITFDYCENNTVSGDLLISLDRVEDNAKQENVSRETELYRVCFHGVLHLVGYKDKSEQDIIIMRKKEDYYLSML